MKCLFTILLLAPLLAQETIPLRPDAKIDPSAPPERVEPDAKGGPAARAISNVSQPALTVHLPPTEKATGTAIIVCPGGGYRQLMIDREGNHVAGWLNSIGVAGIVLKYRMPRSMEMRASLADLRRAADAVRVSLEDAQEAVRVVRANAARWNLKPNAVGMMGFSAGGHLTAMTGMLAPPEARPDFLVLLYPAIPRTLEVTSSTPRTFLASAYDDPRLSPADHSVRFYLALVQAHVSAEMHLYSSGGHGFALLKNGSTASAWPETFARWLSELPRR